MLLAFITSATLQNAFLQRFQTFDGNNCKYYNKSYFQDVLEFSTTLRQVTLQISSVSECNSTYVAWGSTIDHMICAEVPNGGKGAYWVIGS